MPKPVQPALLRWSKATRGYLPLLSTEEHCFSPRRQEDEEGEGEGSEEDREDRPDNP